MEFHFVENAKICYGRGLTLLKMLKEGTAECLFCLKCKSKVRLEFLSVKNAVNIRYNWGFGFLKM